jgi:hypothetical protein
LSPREIAAAREHAHSESLADTIGRLLGGT